MELKKYRNRTFEKEEETRSEQPRDGGKSR
jgi:hypothetical protein